ncbi:hypothetical protein MARINON1_50334 [Marinobacter salarius]|nr:hypothetical protein MBHK15_120335 [Marinobacter salarius]VXB40594.1 hypothetical protein MARINON1_50334 [Marinobacter salarius]
MKAHFAEDGHREQGDGQCQQGIVDQTGLRDRVVYLYLHHKRLTQLLLDDLIIASFVSGPGPTTLRVTERGKTKKGVNPWILPRLHYNSMPLWQTLPAPAARHHKPPAWGCWSVRAF